MLRLRAQIVPANDNRVGAQRIAALPFTSSQDTTEMTVDPTDPVPSCNDDARATVWFRYDAVTETDLAVTTAGSDFDTVLSIFREDGGTLTEVACHDDINFDVFDCLLGRPNCDLTSELQTTVAGGNTYFIMASGGAIQPTGNLLFNVDGTFVGPLPPPTITYNVSSAALLAAMQDETAGGLRALLVAFASGHMRVVFILPGERVAEVTITAQSTAGITTFQFEGHRTPEGETLPPADIAHINRYAPGLLTASLDAIMLDLTGGIQDIEAISITPSGMTIDVLDPNVPVQQ